MGTYAPNLTRWEEGIGISLIGDQMVYRPLPDFKYIGVYHGFPVPLPKGIINGRITGTM